LQGQAEAIVQVALRLEHLEALGQHGGNSILCSGFAGAAGNADDPPAPGAPNGLGQHL
jgi:hypothetical protein